MPKKTKKTNEEKPEKTTKSGAGFFEKLVSATGNKLAQAASNGIISGDITGWIDTGVYLLNAQLSGSLYGGIPDNKIVVLAGPEAVGKTYFVLSMVKYFLDSDPEAGVIFCESEGAITKEMLEERGVDTTRVFIVPVSTVQEWRTQSLQILASYDATPEKQRRRMMFCLDSLGMLSTTKEMTDSEAGKETADMTRARQIKAAFRTLTLKLGVLGVPFLITNHTYDTQGMFSTRVMSGGSGTKYSNSITLFLSKAKAKDGDEIIGALIGCTLKKGRLTKENTQIHVLLDYVKGLHRYYGLLDLALKYDIATPAKDEKGKTLKGKYQLGDNVGSEKSIYHNPEKFFTPEVMAQLEEVAAKEFKYGSAIDTEEEEIDEVEDDFQETEEVEE